MKKKLQTRFPATRIKKIMQTDEEIGKIALAVPLLISKALELFLQDLCNHTYDVTLSRGGKTVSSFHLKQCVQAFDVFDFLRETVGRVPDLGGSDAKDQSDTKRRKLVDESNCNDEDTKTIQIHEVKHSGSGRGRGGRGRGRGGGRTGCGLSLKCEEDLEDGSPESRSLSHDDTSWKKIVSQNNPSTVIGDANHISGYSFCAHHNIVHPSAELGSKTTVGPHCMLGEGSQVSDKCSLIRSAIGRHCWIGSNMKTVNSVVVDNVTIVADVQYKAQSYAVTHSFKSVSLCQVESGFVVCVGSEHKGETLLENEKKKRLSI